MADKLLLETRGRLLQETGDYILLDPLSWVDTVWKCIVSEGRVHEVRVAEDRIHAVKVNEGRIYDVRVTEGH